MEPRTKLLDHMRNVMRLKHMSLRTEEAYVSWVKRFILFHEKRHPNDMGVDEIRAFLTRLAVQGNVAASTQNGALNALVFLYHQVLKQPFPELEGIERAKRLRRIPTVFTAEETQALLAQLSGTPHLMAGLLYGAGLRLMECVRLRVKDVDFAYQQITVRDGKGAQDRVTMLPQSLQESLQRHLVKVQLLHEEDLQEGYGDVYLPYAFERKDPNSGKSWLWQYVFPASKRSIDPRSGIERRHHISEAILQRAVKHAIRQAGICKRGSCHTLRHSSVAGRLPQHVLAKRNSLPRRFPCSSHWASRLGRQWPVSLQTQQGWHTVCHPPRSPWPRCGCIGSVASRQPCSQDWRSACYGCIEKAKMRSRITR